MTTPPSFPVLNGLGWSVRKTPLFSTRIASHVSGREVRAPYYVYPLYEFEVIYNVLLSGAASGAIEAQSLQTLMGFYLQMQGQFGTFIYTDPTDNSVTTYPVGTGDGSTTTFTLTRAIGSSPPIPVGWVLSISAVYLNGSLVLNNDIFSVPDIFAVADIFSIGGAVGYSVIEPNLLVFNTAPGVGVVITATFTYGFLCRFSEDSVEFEEFMSGLWQVGSLKFRSVKA